MKDIIDKIINFIVKDSGMELISAFIGLLGVYWTIQYTRNQFNDDKRMGTKPYLDLSLCNQNCETEFTYKDEDNEHKMGYWEYLNENTYYVDPKNDSESKSGSFFYVELEIENIGLGHAIDYKIINIYGENSQSEIKENIDIIRKDDKSNMYIVISKRIENEYLTLLEEFINIKKEQLKIREEFWISNQDQPENKSIIDKLITQSREEIYIDVEYKDILNNKYKKTFCLELHFYIEKDLFSEKDIIKGETRILRNKYNEKLIKRKSREKI